MLLPANQHRPLGHRLNAIRHYTALAQSFLVHHSSLSASMDPATEVNMREGSSIVLGPGCTLRPTLVDLTSGTTRT